MDSEIVQKLRARYARLPLLIVQRSIERATTEAELFDILDSVPDSWPMVWNNVSRRWESTQLFRAPVV